MPNAENFDLTVLPETLPSPGAFQLEDILTDGMAMAVRSIPEEFLASGEKELRKHRDFDKTDHRLRFAFWQEHARVADRISQGGETCSKMRVVNIYGSVCSRKYFEEYVLKDKVRLAFILIPPAEYKVAMEEALTYGIERIREILELPVALKVCRCHYECKCRGPGRHKPRVVVCKCKEKCICPPKIDSRTADVIFKITEHLDNRVKGSIIQRAEARNLNINTEMKSPAAPKAESMEELDRRIKELEARAALPPGESQVIIDLAPHSQTPQKYEPQREAGEGESSPKEDRASGEPSAPVRV